MGSRSCTMPGNVSALGIDLSCIHLSLRELVPRCRKRTGEITVLCAAECCQDNQAYIRLGSYLSVVRPESRNS